ncbi:MAG TPA: OmpH family outer membrane protein [Burkholderiales bacterium]|nr:OmpH family outer membrane protein [Burkholderiales bacterium]
MRGSKTTRLAVAGCIFPVLLLAAGPAACQTSIGFVSLDRILREAPPAQQAQKKLEQEFSGRAQDLQRQADQLKKMQENLEKNAVTMSESERQKRDREFGDANREFQRKQREFNEDLAQKRKEEFERVIERANRAVREIAEAEKLDVVFQNEQVVWASTRIDITDKVIKALSEPRPGAK